MTFDEWARQVHREIDSKMPLELVKDIMVNSIRVAFEELYSNPAEADLDIMGIGRFYLNRRICHNNFPDANHPEYAPHWTIQFKPSKSIKDAFNGKKDPRELVIGYKIPLYPIYMCEEDGTLKKQVGFVKKARVRRYRVDYTVTTNDSSQKGAKKRWLERKMKSIPKEDDE